MVMKKLFYILMISTGLCVPSYAFMSPDDYGVIEVEEVPEQEEDIFYDDSKIPEEKLIRDEVVLKIKKNENANENKVEVIDVPEYKPEELKESAQNLHSYTGRDIPAPKTVSFSKEKKLNDKTSAGVQYDTKVYTDSVSQTRTIYSKYDVNNNLSVKSTYSNNSLSDINNQVKGGTVGIGPEYKINKHMSVSNTYSHNLSDKSNKGEVSVKMRPFKDDRMDFSAGASQVQYQDGGPAHSRFDFGTQIRF